MIGWRKIRILLLCCVVLCATARAAEDSADPARLIPLLQHDDFETRRATIEKLHALGEAARAALEEAAANTAGDVDTRQALRGLLQKLDTSTLRLIAFDRDGKPASGAEADIQLYSTENSDWNEQRGLNVTFDKDGQTMLEEKFPLKARMNINFRNWAGASVHAVHYGLDLRRGENTLPLVAMRPAKVTAAVVDAENKPLKDVHVSLVGNMKFDEELIELQVKAMERWGGFGGNRPLNGVTGDDGKLTIENVPDGVYGCLLKRDGFSTLYVPAVRVREGGVLELPALRLAARKTGKINVTVYGADGKPAKGDTAVLLEPVINEPDGPRKAEKLAKMRQIMQQMRWNNDRPQPDEKGKIELKDIPVGKYRLVVYVNNLSRCIDEVEVKDGQTTDAGAMRSVAPGAITGKVVDEDGKPLQGVNVFVARQSDFEAEVVENRLNLHTLRQFPLSYGWGHTQGGGTYEVKNLPEGKYVVVLTHQNSNSVIFDVNVPADRPVIAPQASFQKTKLPRNEIKGKVLLADGKPAAGAMVLMVAGFGSTSRHCENNGFFNMYNYYDGVGQLIIMAAKHRPRIVDFAAGDGKSGELTINLEPQVYGALNVQVADEAGQPIAGALVEPALTNSRYYWRYQRTPVREQTDKAGAARLEGLFEGERKMIATKRGYVMKSEVRVMVSGAKDESVTIVLRQALELPGRVEAPAGSQYEHMAVMVSPQSTGAISTMAPVGPGGNFVLHGLTAGEYELSAVGPGLINTEKPKITLKADAPAVPPVVLKLIPPAAVVVQLPPPFRGYQGVAMPVGQWNPETDGAIEKRMYTWSQTHVDQGGRFEQYGLAPGKYDLYLVPAIEQQRYYYSYNQNSMKMANATQIVPGIDACAIAGVALLNQAPAQVLTLEPGSATVEGNFLLNNPKGLPHCQLMLLLAGPQGFAGIQYNAPGDFMRVAPPPPTLLNAPPGLTIVTENSTGFRLQQVPVGEYTLYAKLHLWNNAEFNTAAKLVKLKTLSVTKPGETVRLGDVTFEVPAEVLARQARPKVVESEYCTDDTVQLFKP